MKVSLVSPPTSVIDRYPRNHPLRRGVQVTEPLGLGYLASMVEDIAEIEIIDCIAEDLNIDECILKLHTSDIIGISVVTSNVHIVNHLIAKLKRYYPKKKIVLGGIHPSLCPYKILMNENVDLVVIGEGEYTLRKIVEGKPYSKIAGLGYRENHKFIVNPSDPLEKDLDKFPFPARHLLKMDLYKPFLYLRSPVHSLISSRGCPFTCTYCCRDISGKHYRCRDPLKVVEEVKELVDKWGAKEVAFQDPIFGLNKKWVKTFCESLIAEKLDVVWSALTRVDRINKDSLELMKKSGCWMIYFGIEAGTQTLLNNIKKKTTLNMIRKAVELTSSIGIKTWGSFMFALPGETPRSAQATLDFAKRLPLDFASFHLTTPFLGTELRKNYHTYGRMTTESSDFTQLNPVFIPFGWEGKVEELKKFFSGAFRSFYARPSYIVRQFYKMRSKEELAMYIRGLKVV